jgi:hypothetical protein
MSQRTHSFQISNPQLQDRVAAFGTGLLRLVGLETGESNVLLLLNDSIGPCQTRPRALSLIFSHRIRD